MSRKKSKIRVKRKQTKKKRSKIGGTLTPSQKREKMLKLEELERKMKELRLKKQKRIRLKKREEKEHKKQELQRNMSADRAKIPNFEERNSKGFENSTSNLQNFALRGRTEKLGGVPESSHRDKTF